MQFTSKRGAIGLAVLSANVLAACGGAEPPPRTPLPHAAASPAAAPPVAEAKPSDPRDAAPRVEILLRPMPDPTPIVHVELAVSGPSPSLHAWRVDAGGEAALQHLTVRDDAGDVPFQANGGAVALGRDPRGVVHVRYDVAASDPVARPLGQVVLADRFRAAGESLLLLPDAFDDRDVRIEVRVDGGAIHAPNVATSVGVGAGRRIEARGRALRRASFLAGSMGAAVFDTPEGHDEAAWLGYTAFDPRPAAAELAQIRTAMGELYSSRDEPPFTFLVYSHARPVGSYTTTARAGSVLLLVGPGEPWTAPLRLSLAQQVLHRWVGGELWVGPTDPAHEAESYWFTEGVARFLAARLLGRLGLLGPNDARDAIAGAASVQATSDERGKGNAALAARAQTDPAARALLTARGMLYAARVNALLRARSKGEKSVDTVVLALLAQAREAHKALPESAWVDEVARALDANEKRAFEQLVVAGDDVTLPPAALGPCFRATTGPYVAFDLGYDDRATRESETHEVVGLAEGGPAARAGLHKGDVIEEADFREGHPEMPVVLKVRRGGTEATITYAPRGAQRRGQTWTRLPKSDAACGEVL